MRPEIRLTPPRRARRRIAGLVIPLGYQPGPDQVQAEEKDVLDVVTKDLAVALSTALAETLAALSSAGHCMCMWVGGVG